jgi:hypothetical protein
MRAKRQKGNSSVIEHDRPLSREEGFWPFDDWDPDSDGKHGSTDPLGDDSDPSSIKNYPPSTRGPVEKV